MKMKTKTETNEGSQPTATVLECRDLIEIKEHTVTIPESIMKKLDLKEGDDLVFISEGDGVILRKK